MDIANALVWAPMTAQPHIVPVNTADFLSGQTFQEVCILAHMQEPVVPPHTKGGAVWLHIQQTVVPPYTKGDPTLLPLPLTTKLSNTSIRTVLHLHSNPFLLPITASGTTAAPSHRRLHGINHMLRVKLNMLQYAPDDLTTPKLVMSQGQKGGELIYAHDTSGAKHHGTRTTDETLKQVAHWPSMQQDVAEYVRGCQVCCQVQTANANHTELVTAWQVTLTLHLYQPGDSSLITAYSTHQHLNKLRLQLREQLATQSQTLQTICKYWKGIVVVPCTQFPADPNGELNEAAVYSLPK
ncbi:hypothetical protein DPX16_0289 [Anabarilius grahami]|uniref:Integrase zinc-binding domain-containing protein n=1 Tax=Anabarilius grahami TaxID=495550 RepID=A0A3N0YIL0_ANAGA|nr:hypothetical protein DPX16_0289 [Anabarilius grahami]